MHCGTCGRSWAGTMLTTDNKFMLKKLNAIYWILCAEKVVQLSLNADIQPIRRLTISSNHIEFCVQQNAAVARDHDSSGSDSVRV